MRNEIIHGNVLDPQTWETIPAGSVHCVVTSPPYWGLRDYGVEGQIGLEKTPEEYVERMVEVFRHVWRVLRDDGTLWLNLGSSYAGSNPPKGWKQKDEIDTPGLVCEALRRDGWYRRQTIIWAKPNPMPESVKDRCTKAHEYLFLLTKNPKYFCDMEAVKEPNSEKSGKWGKMVPTKTAKAQGKHGSTSALTGSLSKADCVEKYYTNGRNKRSVWTVTTKPYKEAHFATFPPKLIEPCILAGTSEKGCCPECGKPWVRIVEKGENTGADGPRDDSDKTLRHDALRHSGRIGETPHITTGWEAGCECTMRPQGKLKASPVPCIVFDPFMGSGTTGFVAVENGRDYFGIELNPEYIGMIKKRISKAENPTTYVAQDIPDESPLFDGETKP